MKIKKQRFFFTTFFLTMFSFIVFSQDSRLIGMWTNDEDYSNITSVEFKNDSRLILYQGENQSPTFMCVFDFKKQPIWVDMNANKNGVEAKILGLLDFINLDKIKLELFYGNFEEHPNAFSLGETSQSQLYIFNRLK